MELHERWLADLRSESMKDKLALAEGKITNEEYMDNINKEIDLAALTIREVYALRAKAQKEGNTNLLGKIWIFLNGRSGAFSETLESLLAKRQQYKEDLALGKITPAEHQKFIDSIASAERQQAIYSQSGSMGSELDRMRILTDFDKRFIEAGKLIQGDEKVLVLVPHGTPEQLNAHSLQFWHLQEILNNAIYQEDPDSADIKDPSFTLMDPTPKESILKEGVVHEEREKSDIVLILSVFGYWVVTKTPHVELSDDFRYILKFPEVTLNELFVNNPKNIWVYIDHRQVDTQACENLYHAFARYMQELGRTDINLHLMSGHPTPEWKYDKEMILMATSNGFFVDTALQTPHTQKLITKKELIGHDDTINPSLTSQCRGVNPLSPDNDPSQFYTHGIKPLMPYETPGQGYTVGLEAEQARVQLEQEELTRMSIERFGFVLVDPETGFTLSKEEQDKHAQEMIQTPK